MVIIGVQGEFFDPGWGDNWDRAVVMTTISVTVNPRDAEHSRDSAVPDATVCKTALFAAEHL